jgi:choline oxidase
MECEYLVVGGGTAGAVVARRLADAGYTVALVEAGPTAEHDDRVLTLSRHAELLGSELDWSFGVSGALGCDPLMRYSQAKMLGGCSSHNTSIAFRTPDWDLDDWEAAGAVGWGSVSVRPALDRVMDTLKIESANSDNELADAFVRAAVEWGLELSDFRSGNVGHEVGYFRLNKRGDTRDSSAVAYLFPLDMLNLNLRVVAGTYVHRLLIDPAGRAYGADTSMGEIRASREIILSAGVFQTPKLLMLSGLGPAQHLAQFGIPSVVDLPAVGKHLMDHPGSRVLWKAARPLPPAETHWETGAFSQERGSAYPEIQFHFTTQRSKYTPTLQPFEDDVFSLHPNVTRPRSEGTVRLRSADPYVDPAIEPNWFSDTDGYDMAILKRGLRQARDIGRQRSLAPWIERQLLPDSMTDDRALERYIRSTSTTSYHPCGTCRMGRPDPAESVVGPDLRVLGVSGLRVADASIFPCVPTVNPAITAMMVGERCSDFVLGDPF